MAKTVAIIDYGSGNLHSAAKAFERMVTSNDLDDEVIITGDPADVRGAGRIVLPGQGAFGDCMRNLESVEGMTDALIERVLQQGVPFLGICVGMQLLADRGTEYGETKGLGWIGGDVVPIEPEDPSLKIPHMGWNDISLDQPEHFLLRSINNQKKSPAHFYFVHSFMFQCKDRKNLLAHCDYGGNIAAMIGRDNIAGVQFHPEKSQTAGLNIIADYLLWNP